MTNPATECTRYMGDKEFLQDSLIAQKFATGSYNTVAGECANTQLRDTFLHILDDEHAIQSDIFCTMQSNGWYPTAPAEQQKIQQARQKFSAQP